jgi:hypothetical protein
MAIIVSACFAYVRRESSGCSNVEIRMTKLETMTNDESQNIGPRFLRYSSLVLPSPFVIRASSLAQT